MHFKMLQTSPQGGRTKDDDESQKKGGKAVYIHLSKRETQPFEKRKKKMASEADRRRPSGVGKPPLDRPLEYPSREKSLWGMMLCSAEGL